MVNISKPISAVQAQAYHKEEFANAKENYYTEGERVFGMEGLTDADIEHLTQSGIRWAMAQGITREEP